MALILVSPLIRATLLNLRLMSVDDHHFDYAAEAISVVSPLRSLLSIISKLEKVTSPSFCTTANERVYITATGCEIEFGDAHGLQAAGAGGL